MRIKRGPYLLLALLLACTTGMSQFSMPSSMSPIASSNGFTSNGGNPIVMDGKGECLSVSTGLRVIGVTFNNKGVFGASCIETPPVATVLMKLTSVKVFPNPTHNISILKCEGNFDANLFCQVRVTGLEGKMMMSQMVSMKDVLAGYTINAGTYAAGVYVVNIDFMNQHYNLKLIKL
ncbi:MAG: T9SS type A sorting domain-containing protein [Bacteroidota bacterium]